MKHLFKLFVDICWLKAKPQDVPASSALLLLTVVLVVASGVISMSGSVGGVVPAGMICLLDVVLTLTLLAIFLNLMHLSSRLIQAATAMFGSGVIINLIALPVMWLLGASSENSAYQLVGSVLYLVLLVWSLVIMGHILRHSFNLKLSSGILIAVAYFLLINTLVQTLLPTG